MQNILEIWEIRNYFSMSKVSFIGLGKMGMPMALNLIKKKYKLNLYDVDKKLYKPFIKTNAKPISEVNQLTENSNIFITMLPDGKALNKVVLGKGGIINTIKKNRFSLIVPHLIIILLLRYQELFTKKMLSF